MGRCDLIGVAFMKFLICPQPHGRATRIMPKYGKSGEMMNQSRCNRYRCVLGMSWTGLVMDKTWTGYGQ